MVKVILIHPTCNSNVKAVARGLLRNGILHVLVTTIAVFPTKFLSRIYGIKLLSDLQRRLLPIEFSRFVKLSPFLEMGRILASKMKLTYLYQSEKSMFSIDSVYKSIDHKFSKQLKNESAKGANAVYCYEDGAEYHFREAKKYHMTCFYDLPIGYWRAMHRLLREEISNRPEWADTLTTFKDSKEKLNRKDNELLSAHHVLVASSFTKETLLEFPHKLSNVKVIPYGFPKTSAPKKYVPLENRRLKLLYVGSLTQRKGIANVFEAVEDLVDKVDLTIVGRKVVEDCRPLNAYLEKHRWIPTLTHNKVLKLMRESDVLIFPSLFEGFGLVITEAMSQGTPVVTTDRTGGGDFIKNGENGWLVPASDSLAVKNVLLDILLDPLLIEKVGKEALKTADSRPWSVYEQEISRYIISNTQI